MDERRTAAPPGGDHWLALVDHPLPVAEASAWAVLPSCGATVTFTGTARDHADGRPDVHLLEYEAYEEHAIGRMAEVVAEARRRWPALGRLALLHRTGPVAVTEAAVVVVATAPQPAQAIEAAPFANDDLKPTLPIWNREPWAGGESWGLEPQHLTEVGAGEATGGSWAR
jgi:molybdopterin synthase catalytic subunit